MLGLETVPGPVEAIAVVALVLAESFVLYLGYGAVTAAVAPVVIETIEEG